MENFLRNESSRKVIMFNHEEVEALIRALDDIEGAGDELTEAEQSAKEKLKKIYARQILSHEKATKSGRRI